MTGFGNRALSTASQVSSIVFGIPAGRSESEFPLRQFTLLTGKFDAQTESVEKQADGVETRLDAVPKWLTATEKNDKRESIHVGLTARS